MGFVRSVDDVAGDYHGIKIAGPMAKTEEFLGMIRRAKSGIYIFDTVDPAVYSRQFAGALQEARMGFAKERADARGKPGSLEFWMVGHFNEAKYPYWQLEPFLMAVADLWRELPEHRVRLYLAEEQPMQPFVVADDSVVLQSARDVEPVGCVYIKSAPLFAKNFMQRLAAEIDLGLSGKRVAKVHLENIR